MTIWHKVIVGDIARTVMLTMTSRRNGCRRKMTLMAAAITVGLVVIAVA